MCLRLDEFYSFSRDLTFGVESSFLNLPLFLFYLEILKEVHIMSGKDIFVFVLIAIVAVGFVLVNTKLKKSNKDDTEKK